MDNNRLSKPLQELRMWWWRKHFQEMKIKNESLPVTSAACEYKVGYFQEESGNPRKLPLMISQAWALKRMVLRKSSVVLKIPFMCSLSADVHTSGCSCHRLLLPPPPLHLSAGEGVSKMWLLVSFA